MTSEIKPLKVYTHGGSGPNPYKVVILLNELGLPYEDIKISNPKEESFVKINPNGRVPAIEDPNTGLTIWESGAILEYIVETYDKENKVGATNTADKWALKQLLHFQMSGQGPYFGQAVWFQKFDKEAPSATERYNEQLLRVLGVVDNLLEGKEYFVGGKLTYVDIAFYPWSRIVSLPNYFLTTIWEKYEVEKTYPNFVAWFKRISALPSVQKAYA
ncbi:glutathione S-transferase [Geosmithia morbida]|uniref:Glutathione S-transferase n=1 Tax=Geosmithia morbida TaxID=1094350 RepID=A0A9P4Z357_9HYPO|nr:glutathione S-transferase [Geosmithia morbida]KAF4126592.1 glutathione S-transferase [Geosmithia morbida]